MNFVPLVVVVTSTVTIQVPLAAIVPPLKLRLVLLAAGANVGAPQPLVAAFGAPATCIPAGKLSAKATPVNVVPAFEFVIVNVSVLTPPIATGFGEKALTIEGGAIMVKVALAVPPVKATGPVAVTAPVVFNAAPAVLLVTFTSTAQLAPTTKLATFKRTFVSPEVEAAPVVVVTVPQAAGVNTKVVFASVMPAGNVSGSCTPVNAPGFVFGFVAVNVSTLVPPDAMLVGLKPFAAVGGLYTFNVLVPGVGLLPAFVCSAPAGIVFVAAPVELLVTFTITVQPPAGMLVPFAIVKLPAPAVAVTPVQVPVFPAAPIVIPVGKVSVSALVNMIALVFVLPIVTVRSVFPPLARSDTPNALVNVGLLKSVSVAELLPWFGSV